MKILTMFCALVLAVALAAPVYAEVQNVKVSGDISIYGLTRDNYTTTGSGSGRLVNGATAAEGASSDGFPEALSADYYATITRLRIDADLTDNVSTLVRLINERDWTAATIGGANENIDIDLASITLKEMLYSPLTLILGRQDIRWGSGLVIGDGTTVQTAATGLFATDLSARKSFDAVRAILDYDPWTLDLIIAKVTESGAGADIDVYGVDASYKFAEYNAVFEAYYVDIHDSSAIDSTVLGTSNGTNTSTLGARLTGEPVAKLTGEIEFAYQFGDSQAAIADQDAWAFDIGAVYAFDTTYSPKLGLKYGLRTGQDTTAAATADNEAWNAVFEDQLNGEIFDPNTNIQFIKLSGSLVPVEKLTAGIDYYMYWFAEDLAFPSAPPASAVSADDDAGAEVDVTLSYAYTEDVTIGLVAAWFFPGDAYGSTAALGNGGDETAAEVLATVTVAF